MLCAAYSRQQEEISHSILWSYFKLKRSSNNLWQLRKVVRRDQRAAQRAAQRDRSDRRAQKAQRVRKVRRARKAQRAASSPTGQRTTSTFHRRTKHTWPVMAILKGTARASQKPAVPFSCFLRRFFIMLAVLLLRTQERKSETFMEAIVA